MEQVFPSQRYTRTYYCYKQHRHIQQIYGKQRNPNYGWSQEHLSDENIQINDTRGIARKHKISVMSYSQKGDKIAVTTIRNYSLFCVFAFFFFVLQLMSVHREKWQIIEDTQIINAQMFHH